jgi:hypothetical protein
VIRRGALAIGMLLAAASTAWGQAVEPLLGHASEAWKGHRTRELTAGSDTVRLRIPGVAASAAVRPAQAARLLSEYLGDAEELAFQLEGVRYAAPDHAFAEFTRRFRVRGTRDERTETVFLGYRRVGAEWRLREVNIAP